MIVERDVALAPKTTLGLGGPAKELVRVTSVEELREAIHFDGRVLILGGGSNLVVSDEGFGGRVVQIAADRIDLRDDSDHVIVTAAAGVVWDDFVAQMIETGLAGVECLSGIPGLVGATPMQNVGAYGQEVADTIQRVRVLDRETGEVVDMAPHACEFAYRTSVFKGRDRWIVLEVCFRLPRSETSLPVRYPELARALGVAEGGRAPLRHVRDTVIRLRRGKGMVVDESDPESRSAGSFFMNPIVDAATLEALEVRLDTSITIPFWPAEGGKMKLSAAWLIERAGFKKGYARGRVGISTKHALALVNRGGTTRELLELAREIQDRVREKLGVELVPEPVIV